MDDASRQERAQIAATLRKMGRAIVAADVLADLPHELVAEVGRRAFLAGYDNGRLFAEAVNAWRRATIGDTAVTAYKWRCVVAALLEILEIDARDLRPAKPAGAS